MCSRRDQGRGRQRCRTRAAVEGWKPFRTSDEDHGSESDYEEPPDVEVPLCFEHERVDEKTWYDEDVEYVHPANCLYSRHFCNKSCLAQPAVTRVSRQLREETLRMFYGTNSFCFCFFYDLWLCHDFCPAIGDIKLRMLKSFAFIGMLTGAYEGGFRIEVNPAKPDEPPNVGIWKPEHSGVGLRSHEGLRPMWCRYEEGKFTGMGHHWEDDPGGSRNPGKRATESARRVIDEKLCVQVIEAGISEVGDAWGGWKWTYDEDEDL